MKKESLETFNYIKKECGIEVSPMLYKFIMNPDKLNGLNYAHLKKIVKEYAPIYQHFCYRLDGPREGRIVTTFSFYLSSRVDNKPELKEILKGDMYY